MFGKDKVKAHNRVSKGKSGYKVIRVDDFFRKKDEDRNKKIALGVAGAGLLVGAGLLLKKKGASKLLTKKTNIVKPSTKQVTKIVDDVPITTSTTPKTNLLTPTKKDFPKIEDPWETPILTKIQKDKVNAKSMVPQSENIPLLTGKKMPASRDNLLVTDTRASKKVTSSVARIGEMDKTYKSISPDNLAMKASIKIDHYLKRPRKTSNLGAPPKPTSLDEVVKNSNTKQAQKKVEDRLSRAERQVQKKAKQKDNELSKRNSDLKKK